MVCLKGNLISLCLYFILSVLVYFQATEEERERFPDGIDFSKGIKLKVTCLLEVQKNVS